MDRLAKDGAVLTQFYSASAVCTPSRASLLTGAWQGRGGLWSVVTTVTPCTGRHAVRSGMYPGVLLANSVLGLPHEEVTLGKL